MTRFIRKPVAGQPGARSFINIDYVVVFMMIVSIILGPALFPHHYAGAPAKAGETTGQGRKPLSGWLYVVDSKWGSKEGEILLVDPTAGRVVRTFKSGLNPDAALSPDGTRLYIASTRLIKDGASKEELAIVDTTSGAVLQTVSNPNRIIYSIVPPTPTMAISPNGRWLYFMKYKVLAPFNTLYWVETFDTQRASFLPERANVPSCGWARLLPSNRGMQVQVVCEESKDVRLLKINANGTAIASTLQFALKTGAAQSQNVGSEDGKAKSNSLAGSFLNANNQTISVLRDGRVLGIDVTTHTVTEVASAKIPPGRWVHSSINSTDGNRLFISLNAPAFNDRGYWSADEILTIDLRTSAQLGSIKTNQSFNYLFLGRGGRQLYAVNTSEANLMVIDATTLREVRTIEDIGDSPSLVIEAP